MNFYICKINLFSFFALIDSYKYKYWKSVGLLWIELCQSSNLLKFQKVIQEIRSLESEGYLTKTTVVYTFKGYRSLYLIRLCEIARQKF